MIELTLPLESVENDNDKLVLNFIDEEKGELYDVTWNKQKYDAGLGKSVKDVGKEMQVADWCKQYLGVPIEQVQDAEGQEHTVYVYEGYNSLWKSGARFTEDMFRQIFETTVTDIKVDKNGIEVMYDIDGTTYSSHYRYTQWKNNRQLINPQKRRKQEIKFKETFGVDVEDAHDAVGKKIMVECKKAFSSYYGEIKQVK